MGEDDKLRSVERAVQFVAETYDTVDTFSFPVEALEDAMLRLVVETESEEVSSMDQYRFRPLWRLTNILRWWQSGLMHSSC